MGYSLKREQVMPSMDKDLILKYLLIADRSMTVEFEDSDDEEEEQLAENSDTEESKIENTEETSLQNSSVEEGKDVDATETEESIVISSTPSAKKSISLKEGKLRITHINFKIILKVLSSLQQKEVPVQVLHFAKKIVENLDDIEFVVISNSQEEKLKQLFYYKLFKYISYAFDYEFYNESEINSMSTSKSHSKILQQMSSALDNYAKTKISGHIKCVLKNPKKNLSSVGFIAGISTILRFLSNSTIDSVSKQLHKPIQSEELNLIELLPLVISILKNSPEKFKENEIEKIKKF